MDVDVGNAFAGMGAVVDHQAVAGLVETLFFGDVTGGEEEATEELAVALAGFADARDDALRDDEDVDRGLRVDVADGEYLLVVANDIGGDLPGRDAFKEGNVSSNSTPRFRRRRTACPRTWATISLRSAAQSLRQLRARRRRLTQAARSQNSMRAVREARMRCRVRSSSWKKASS